MLRFQFLFLADLPDAVVRELLKPLGALFGGQGEAFGDVVDFACDGPEDFLVAAHGVLEHADAQQASFVDVGIDGPRCNEVHDGDGFALLAVAVDAPDPLLDPHGIPWQIVVDEKVAELEIQSFATNFRRQQHVDGLGIFLRQREAAPEVRSVVVGYVAMDEADAHASRRGVAVEVRQCMAEGAENKCLIVRPACSCRTGL